MHAILYTISYTVSGAPLRNRTSLSIGFFKIDNGHLKTGGFGAGFGTKIILSIYTPRDCTSRHLLARVRDYTCLLA
jgi:hypothetical protein